MDLEFIVVHMPTEGVRDENNEWRFDSPHSPPPDGEGR